MGLTYGVTPLRQLQYGFEAVAGTALNGDTLWPAAASDVNMINDDREIIVVPVGDGRLVPPDTSIYTPKLTGTLSLPSTPFGFELGNHIFQLGIDAEVATQDGVGTGYVWAYEIGASGNDPKTATFYGGNNAGVERGNYGFATAFAISAEAEGAWMMDSGEIQVRNVEVSSFQSLSASSNEIVLMGNTLLYIDDVGDGFGTTQISGQLHSFTLNVDTGFRPVPVGDGNLYYSAIKNVGADPMATLELTLEHTTTAIAERVNWRAKTPRAVRLIATGSALATPDTYSVKTIIIDFPGVYTEFSTLDSADGDDIMTGTLTMHYNSTVAQACTITVVNELSAV